MKRRRRRARRRRHRRDPSEKQEPHTVMWGKMQSRWRARVDAFEFPSAKEVYKYFKHFLLCVQNRNPEEGGKMLDENEEKEEALNLLNEFLFKSLSAIASSA